MRRTILAALTVLVLSGLTVSAEYDLMPLLNDGLYHTKAAKSLLPPVAVIERECANMKTGDHAIDALYLCLRSEALCELGRTTEALEVTEAAMSLMPKSPRVMVTHGRMLARAKQINTALELCDSVLNSDPRCVPALILRAIIRSDALGQHESALADANHAIGIDDGDARSYLIRALIHRDLGETQQAITDLEKHLSLCPNGPIGHEAETYAQLADLLLKEQRYEEAIRAFDVALHFDERFYPAAKGLWTVYNKRKQHSSALMAAQKMREIDPTNLTSIQALAISCFNTRSYKAGRAHFDDWRSRTGDKLPLSMMAACDVATGEYTRALQLYDEALAVDPTQHNIRLAKANLLATCENESVRDHEAALREAGAVIDNRGNVPASTGELMLASIIQYHCGQKAAAIQTIDRMLTGGGNLSAKQRTQLRALRRSFALNEDFKVRVPSVAATSGLELK